MVERAMGFSYKLSIAISNHSAANCHRMSQTRKSTGVSHFGANFGEKGIDRCESNLNVMWETHGPVVCTKNRVDIFCCLGTMHEHNRQTNRQTMER